ncbi:pyridoxamine 5'-phosphate oxidase family protein [Chloroflexi bacterium]|nr:pyridoxamine 5'-phosphate oxidase family protein [Chloroflexota bacterium]
MPEKDLNTTDKTKVIRIPDRGSYDRELAYKIIDDTPICHVSYLINGEPYITPTLQWRSGDNFYWHGSSASRFLRSIVDNQVAINVMIFDGLVLARSGMHHSANYRSVTLFGKARKLNENEKELQLEKFMNNLLPGRWNSLRKITGQEVKATTLFTIPIEEASVKVRTGAPIDDEEDYELPIWAGIIPIKQVVGSAIADDRNLPGVEIPDHVTNYKLS